MTVLSLARFLPDKVKNRKTIGNGKLATLQQGMTLYVRLGGGGRADFKFVSPVPQLGLNLRLHREQCDSSNLREYVSGVDQK